MYLSLCFEFGDQQHAVLPLLEPAQSDWNEKMFILTIESILTLLGLWERFVICMYSGKPCFIVPHPVVNDRDGTEVWSKGGYIWGVGMKP